MSIALENVVLNLKEIGDLLNDQQETIGSLSELSRQLDTVFLNAYMKSNIRGNDEDFLIMCHSLEHLNNNMKNIVATLKNNNKGNLETVRKTTKQIEEIAQ